MSQKPLLELSYVSLHYAQLWVFLYFFGPELQVHAMSGHGHGPGGGHSHGCCECDHEPAERGVEYELYIRIDIEKLQCLNESRDGDGKRVFKPWDQRTDRAKVPINLV